MHRILIIEDEPKLAAILAEHLQRYGYEAQRAKRFDDLKNEFLESGAQLALLDVNLPWYDGFYWCRQIRAASNAPIIFISARSGEMDQVMAIDNGGDDYITKPFNLDLVTAKVRAALRRAYGEYAAEQGSGSVESSGLRYDPARLRAEHAGRVVELSRNEGQLLEALLRAQGRVIGRQTLLAALWDDAQFIDDNTLTVNVNRLRRKLTDVGLEDAVRTVRGEGYQLALPAGKL